MLISSEFKFSEFIEHIKDMGIVEIIIAGCNEVDEVERISFRIKGSVKTRDKGSLFYTRKLKNFIYFLRNGTKPGSASDDEFASYRSIVEKLIQRGQLKPEVLKNFDL